MIAQLSGKKSPYEKVHPNMVSPFEDRRDALSRGEFDATAILTQKKYNNAAKLSKILSSIKKERSAMKAESDVESVS